MKQTILATLLVALLALPFAASAQDETPDPKALIGAAMKHSAAQPRLALDGALNLDINASGREESVDFRFRLELGEENGLYYSMKAPEDALEIFSNDEALVMYFIDDKAYAEKEPPSNRAEIIGIMPGQPGNLVTEWLGSFLHNEPSLLKDTTALVYSGVETIDGVECHKLRGKLENGPLSIWIQKDGDPWLRQIALDLSSGMNGGHLDVTLGLSGYDTAITFADNRFAFTPPEGVITMEERMEEERAALSPVGKPAPDLKKPMLDGSEFDLASFEGKNVVILDFWATWCRPCHIGLPIVSKVAKDYEDKGVKFFAVNVGQEDSETVNSFLENFSTPLTVVHDETAQSMRFYAPEGIPTTVIIDKEGVIRSYHVGVARDAEEQLRADLDEVLEIEAK